MKMLINPCKIGLLLAVAIAPLLGKAGDGVNVDKKRTISKVYTVGADDRLSIENSFGNVTVDTWDKNVIQVDIEIGVQGTTDEKAQEMLNQISVSDNQSGNEISFKTAIGHISGKKNNNDNGVRKFYVDYKVRMPLKNALSIENQFGKTVVPDLEGIVELVSKFGELTTGSVNNAKRIQVEFGKATVGRLNNADLVLKYNGNSTVAGLGGNSKVDVQFCGKVNIAIDNTVKDLAVFQSYSTINLKVPVDFSASFDVHTNFGSFKNRTAISIAEDKEDQSSGPKFDRNYTGSAGSGRAKIKIKSSFGSVRVANTDEKASDKDDKDDSDDAEDDKDEKVKL